jgi:CRP/FNR family transcriptional regulator
VLRLISNEIETDQQMLTLLNRKNVEQHVATFLISLNKWCHTRGLSTTEFYLTMTFSDIGLTVKSNSLLLNHFHKSGLINVNSKLITIVDIVNLGDTDAA